MTSKPVHTFVSTSLSAIIVNLFLVLQLVILPYFLTPQEMGLATSTLVVIGLLQTYNDLGFSNALLHFQNANKTQLNTLYIISFGVGILLSLLLFATSPFIANFFNQPRLGILLKLASIGLILTSIGQQFLVLLQRDLHFSTLAKIDIISAFVGIITGIGAAYLWHDAFAVILSYLAAAAIKNILASVYGRTIWTPGLKLSFENMRTIFNYSLYQLGERTINYLFRNLDKILIAKVLGPQFVAIYNLAYQMATKIVSVVTPIFTKIMTPLYAKHQHNTEQMNQDCLALHQIQAVIFFPLSVALFVMAKPIIYLVLPETWHNTAPILQGLAPLCALYALGNPLGSVLIAKGRADIGFHFNLFASGVYALVMWISLPYGLNAMAWSISVATLLFVPVDIAIRRKLLNQTLKEYMSVTLAPAISACISGIVCFYTLRAISGSLIQIIVGTSVGFAVYATSLLLLKPKIITEMRALWQNRF